MREEKSVYKALFSEQEPKKVELKYMNVLIQEWANRAFSMEEDFDNALTESRKQYILAKDIWKFDFREALVMVEEKVSEYKSALKDLGIDSTPQLKKVEKDLAGVKKLDDEMKRKLDQF